MTENKRYIGVISLTGQAYEDFLRDRRKKGDDVSDYIRIANSEDVRGRYFKRYVLLFRWYTLRDAEDLVDLIKRRYGPDLSPEMIEIKGKYLDREEIQEFRQDWEKANNIGG